MVDWTATMESSEILSTEPSKLASVTKNIFQTQMKRRNGKNAPVRVNTVTVIPQSGTVLESMDNLISPKVIPLWKVKMVD